MTKQAKIIIFSLILFASFAMKHCNDDGSTYKRPTSNQPKKNYGDTPSSSERKSNNTITNYDRPDNGFSPYNSYFGNGIYNNNTQNSFIIKNDNSTDAVVLLVDAYSKRKIRNEYIRKGNTFSMTGVPNGTFYLRWISGNNWSPNLQVGNLRGGFQKDQSFSETQSSKDWMQADGLAQWTVTLYSVAGGTVGIDNLNANEFTN